MTKTDLLQEIEDKIQIYSSAIGIAYILGSGAWRETFKGYVGPGVSSPGILPYKIREFALT